MDKQIKIGDIVNLRFAMPILCFCQGPDNSHVYSETIGVIVDIIDNKPSIKIPHHMGYQIEYSDVRMKSGKISYEVIT